MSQLSRSILLKVDLGIRREVQILSENGIETIESCEGGKGHAFSEPTIVFSGARDEGFKALAIALAYDLKVYALHRTWRILEGEPVGPEWQMTFCPLRSSNR